MKKPLGFLTIFALVFFFGPILPAQAVTQVAFDAITGSKTSTCASFTHTPTGSSNLFVIVGVEALSGDVVTAATYGGTSMTLANKQNRGDGRWDYLFYLQAPATGAQTVAFTSTENTQCLKSAVTYTGAAQTGQPFDSQKGQGTSASPSLALSATTNGLAAGVEDNANGDTAGSNTTVHSVAPNGVNMADTTVSTATINLTQTPSGNYSIIAVTISPAVAATSAIGAVNWIEQWWRAI